MSENQKNYFQSAISEFTKGSLQIGSGFLSSQPGRWVPSFTNHWAAILNNLKVDCKIAKIEPAFTWPINISHSWLAELNGEKIGLIYEEHSLKLLNLLSESFDQTASSLVEEYFARRFFTALDKSWTGPRLDQLRFVGRAEISQIEPAAAVKITYIINNELYSFWLLIEQKLFNLLDNLWRRQTQSINLAELRIAEAEIFFNSFSADSVLSAGDVLPLNEFSPSEIMIAVDNRTAYLGELGIFEGQFAAKITGELAYPADLSTKTQLKLGKIFLEPNQTKLLEQAEYTFTTGISLDAPLTLTATGSKDSLELKADIRQQNQQISLHVHSA